MLKCGYILKTSNNSYIGIDKRRSMYLTSDINNAHPFKTKHKAENVCRDFSKRKGFSKASLTIIPYNIDLETDEKKVLSKPKLSLDIYEKCDIIGNNRAEDTYRNKLRNISDSIKSFSEDKEKLLDDLSIVDKKISDVMHYIESSNFSASKGYKLAKLLQDLRKERRGYKNKLAYIAAIDQHGVLDAVDKVSATWDKIDYPSYTPRILNELFN